MGRGKGSGAARARGSGEASGKGRTEAKGKAGRGLGSPQARVEEVVARLWREYPSAKCSLDFRSPFQLLVATILSAQCTDERVNQVTPALFARYADAETMSAARQEELEELIRPTGFFRNKAKALLGMSTALVERHGGAVPREMDALVALPGVGRKTANVVLGNAFETAAGVVVDTHVKRLSGRLGFAQESDPEKIEQELMRIVPRRHWIDLPHLFIYHGRAVCKAPTPRCEACVIEDLCPSSLVHASPAAKRKPGGARQPRR